MDTKKFVTGTLVGGIASFILGYLVYGVAMASFFNQHSTAPAGAMKGMGDIVWWALILGNLAGGALLTYVFLKLGNVNTFASGARIGASIGFFVSLSYDLVRYATENSLDLTAALTDTVLGVIMSAIVGGVIAAVLGMGNKKA